MIHLEKRAEKKTNKVRGVGFGGHLARGIRSEPLKSSSLVIGKIILVGAVFAAQFALTVIVYAQKPPPDAEQLRGVWKVVSAKYRLPETEKRGLEYYFKFDGDTLKSYRKTAANGEVGGEVLYITLDTMRKPKQIDMFGKRNKSDTPLLGIYAIEKDQLKLSWSMNDGRDRLANFEVDRADKKTRHISLILGRVKEKN
ncbi:MAG: TIGR03067 domain-containing protein [Gemmataceae bacterium]|nr:TIGR03067 domain-containing protein [Gemmataceae bacterium]